MPSESRASNTGRDLALIVQKEGKAESTLAKFVKLLLNYRYGLPAEVVTDFMAVTGILRRSSKLVRCVCVIQDQVVNPRTGIPALGNGGRRPLFLVLPGHVVRQQRQMGGKLDNVFLCPWEMALTNDQGGLQQVVIEGLSGAALRPFEPGAGLKGQVRERLAQLDTLPTLPNLVMHIVRLVTDPKTTMAQLEELLSSDPAIVLKVMQVANSPVFAGLRKGEWSLKEAIVRLGLRKVGAIAQQIALIDSFVVPDDSRFDLQRFWEHSVGCALVADKLVEGGFVTLGEPVEYDDYWLGSLLHDIGLLVQGFFFAEWFERIVRMANGDTVSYHMAELEMAGSVTHELVGQLLMIKSRMPERLVTAVASHHSVGDNPTPLVALVHVANAMVKELGLAYLDDEKVDYSRPALEALGLTGTGVRAVREVLEESVVGQVKQLVKQCMN